MTRNRFLRGPVKDQGLHSLLRRIEARLVKPNIGLLVRFEGREFSLDGFREEAFYLYLPDKELGDKPPPPELLEDINSERYEHYIWMPKRFILGDRRRLAVRYAHECRHLGQQLDGTAIDPVRKFFEYKLNQGWRSMNYYNEVNEFDANLVAYSVFEHLFGAQEWESYCHDTSEDSKVLQGFNALHREWINYSLLHQPPP